MDRQAAQTYRTQQIMTASPAQLVALLYGRAISSLNEAIRAIETGDIEGRWRANARAQEIIAHLLMTLDRQKGGEVAENLRKLFSFMLSRLPQVDFRNDATTAREVIGLLEPLQKSWAELALTVRRQPAAAAGVTGAASPAVPARPASAPGSPSAPPPSPGKISVSA